MWLIFIQALQLERSPKNHTDIGVSAQVCDTVTDAVAVADGTAVTPFRSGLEISIRWK